MDESIRDEMVNAAKKFMTTPKVRESSFEEQKAFLLGKGVTEAEIDEARRLVSSEGMKNGGGHDVHPSYAYYPPPPPQNRIMSTVQAALVIGSVSYASYKMLRSWVLPKFFDIPDPAAEDARRLQEEVTELHNSIKFVMDSVSQTSKVLTEQQTEVASALATLHCRDGDLRRIEASLTTIRSLLLSQNQFVPPANAILSIPDWQKTIPDTEKKSEDRHSLTDSLNAASGYTTPPSNMNDDGEEEDEMHDAPN